jgi:hypothetical protein
MTGVSGFVFSTCRNQRGLILPACGNNQCACDAQHSDPGVRRTSPRFISIRARNAHYIDVPHGFCAEDDGRMKIEREGVSKC